MELLFEKYFENLKDCLYSKEFKYILDSQLKDMHYTQRIEYIQYVILKIEDVLVTNKDNFKTNWLEFTLSHLCFKRNTLIIGEIYNDDHFDIDIAYADEQVATYFNFVEFEGRMIHKPIVSKTTIADVLAYLINNNSMYTEIANKKTIYEDCALITGVSDSTLQQPHVNNKIEINTQQMQNLAIALDRLMQEHIFDNGK